VRQGVDVEPHVHIHAAHHAYACHSADGMESRPLAQRRVDNGLRQIQIQYTVRVTLLRDLGFSSPVSERKPIDAAGLN
jgi:hypothetical protein